MRMHPFKASALEVFVVAVQQWFCGGAGVTVRVRREVNVRLQLCKIKTTLQHSKCNPFTKLPLTNCSWVPMAYVIIWSPTQT